MSLRGELKEFGVPEIFQLLEQQGKTGCLLLQFDSAQIEVYFSGGKIVGAIPDGLEPAQYLIKTLQKQGLLSDPEEERVREIYGKELRGLPEILQQQSILEHREMDLLLKEQIKELLFPLFTCRNGKFLFDSERALSSEWSLLQPVAVEPLILEGLRRTDEWPLVKQRIGPLQAVPRRQFVAAKGGDGNLWNRGLLSRLLWWRAPGMPDLPDKELFPQEMGGLSSAEKIVYNLIDGKRTVEQIVWASSLGDYAASKALLDLCDQGWIRIDPVESVREGAAAGPGKRGLGRWVMATAVLIALVLGVSYLSQSTRITWIQDLTEAEGRPVCRLLNHHQRVRVARAVDLYLAENGTVPSRLTDLVRAHLIRETDLSLWGDNAFAYQPEPPASYRLIIAPSS